MLRPVFFFDSVVLEIDFSVAEKEADRLSECRDVEVGKFVDHFAGLKCAQLKL